MDWKILAVIILAIALAISPFCPLIKAFKNKKTAESGENCYSKLSWWTEFFGR